MLIFHKQFDDCVLQCVKQITNCVVERFQLVPFGLNYPLNFTEQLFSKPTRDHPRDSQVKSFAEQNFLPTQQEPATPSEKRCWTPKLSHAASGRDSSNGNAGVIYSD
jgi:hypothetical protein